MPALTDIGKYKRLAELLVITLKTDMVITAEQNNIALQGLMDFGLSERQAEQFMNAAFENLDRGLTKSPREVLDGVATAFRFVDHGYILGLLQAILERKGLSDKIQGYFDVCCEYLYHSDTPPAPE
jgi:hypothetical protein